MLPSRNRGCSSVAVASPRLRKGEVEDRALRTVECRAVKDLGADRVRKDAIVTGAMVQNG